jgi:photosystem II stability/assembly factor-like uncharacterized protein
MRHAPLLVLAAGAAIMAAGAPPSQPAARATSVDPAGAMHWRHIGPTRAGRARAVAGVAARPNLAYIGFDNGGVWRSSDYGSNWEPLFDRESTGSIGAIAVAQSDPNVVYVGTGAGIIRPDLATGDGIYKSTDAGKTWTRVGLHDSQMIAHIDVSPRDPNRLFVAVLGHPYGPSAERGIFRSTDGGRTFEKVLYKDEYTSGNDVRIDPSNPDIVYAALWQQQQSYIEGGGFGGTQESNSGGVFKSTDGGATWKPLTQGLPNVLQANLAIAQSHPGTLYAIVGVAPAVGGPSTALGAGRGGRGAGGGRGEPAQAPQAGPPPGGVAIYKTTDGGDRWTLAAGTRQPDPRPLARIGGGDLPTLAVDPKDPNVVYSCSVVLWRTEDGGVNWSAVRGAPGGDDYQKMWINPNDTGILLVVSDQGAVISANRGASWSNWYTQPTAAMYHVSTDNAFPYRVCGGQQDSGSACVDSRSNDGRITFHDWHPVNIQEYGEAAPDPKNPDLVYGSARTNVSLYNRKTGQTKSVGPNFAALGEKDQIFSRNVRTMPLEWSPVNPNVLFYAQNAVYKTIDGGANWTRISGDLTRQTWEVPANVGKYAGTVTPAPQGSITALSPSPKDVNILWAGTDDGHIQVTTNGGQTWRTVTPPQIKPWTRIFNIEAGHFDTLTAFAAANTMRIDDWNPHFWRTRDGGKTWIEINNGIAPGWVSNSIREDPKQKGLLYAATDTQVWVSFDEGDSWQSLRLDMPAISVRDLLLKDDPSCLCSDLVAGTHGRGYWILDNVTPLREAAAIRTALSAGNAYLVKPAPAVRVRFGMNDPTPWPPEVPAGENPPPGATLDYLLASDASGPVTIDILDGAGAIVRTYSSTDPVRTPDPALDPEAYDKLCQQTPGAADCNLPLYWPARPMTIGTRAGMHRVSWDLRYQPLGEGGGRGGGAAVPRRTYPAVNAPWAPPGAYTVRLGIGGKTFTQPLTLHLDPRVKTPALALSTLSSLTREMYTGARKARDAAGQARALSAALESVQGPEADAMKKAIAEIAAAPPAAGGRGGFGGPSTPLGAGGRGGGAASASTLDGVSGVMLAAAMAMQGADVAPTGREIAACADARRQSAAVMARWTKIATVDLSALNAKRKAAGLSAIVLPDR